MTRFNFCEFFRFNDRYCDVFEEEPGRYLYAECEPFNWAHLLTCKEFTPADNGGYIVGPYCGASAEYLHELEPAPVEIARAIIASEERYTLECMANGYGYTREYVLECYREQVDDGSDTHEAFMYVAGCMMEYDL